ncbi:GntR family transcriptional regulator [Actinocorallia sp. A-T 12471]|uniref:GntR family transcriptional regulator n=1 Tax=Actinocorallia sp. A-T 12471 TaxID=3089813 RepID=UPI0029D39EF2|nr:GntR family transcriptional regulator [Actinocorallia sp. A-T 12471]MDX6744572.1 GntR family transcriptional regulator [Actinocorallia sp. A-T 12471]
MIDATSPVPKYVQLRALLVDLIEEAGAEPDAPMPSERELCQRYGLSRMTVRQAVDQLVSEGRLYRVPGKGTFVARPKIDMPVRLSSSFTAEMKARGMTPGAIDLDHRTVPASGHVARALGLAAGAYVHVLERLRTADGAPMAVERCHIPAALAPDLLTFRLAGQSLYDLLERRYGISFDSGDQTIEAAIATPLDAELLQLPQPSPVLLLRRRSYLHSTCAELTESTYRADRYQLHTTLDLPRQPADPRAAQ